MLYDMGDIDHYFITAKSHPGTNPRKHADYAENAFILTDLDFDLDMELKNER